MSNVMFETQIYMIPVHKWVVLHMFSFLPDGFILLCHMYHQQCFMLNYCDYVYKLCYV